MGRSISGDRGIASHWVAGRFRPELPWVAGDDAAATIAWEGRGPFPELETEMSPVPSHPFQTDPLPRIASAGVAKLQWFDCGRLEQQP